MVKATWASTTVATRMSECSLCEAELAAQCYGDVVHTDGSGSISGTLHPTVEVRLVIGQDVALEVCLWSSCGIWIAALLLASGARPQHVSLKD